MEKLSLLIILLLASGVVHGIGSSTTNIDQSPKAVKKWFTNLPHAEEKLTNLHFYFHDSLSGKNPTATAVAQSTKMTPKSPTLFGIVFVMDDPLTIGPESDSKVVGYARGMYASAAQEELDLLMTLSFVFTDSKYNGSSLSVLGHNPAFHEYRELPIVGGSCVFRLARGIAAAKTYTFEAATGNAIVEYYVSITHY